MKKMFITFSLLSLQAYAIETTNIKITTTNPSSSLTIESQRSFMSGFSLGANMGTLGVGINLSHFIYKDYLDLRFNANYFQYNSDIASNPYAIKMNTYGMLLDYKPFGGNFRISGGLYYNNNSLSLNAGNSLYLNGQTYTSDQISNASSSITFNPISPYVGVGFGSTNSASLYKRGLYFSGDVGVLYSTPSVSLNATCNSSGSMDCTDFNSNLDTERNNIQNTVNSYAQFYPVINFIIGYSF